MIARRGVACAIGVGWLGAHRLGRAQGNPLRRVGLLLLGTQAEGGGARLAALAQGMRELGWLEGTSVEYRSAFVGGDADRLARPGGNTTGMSNQAPEVLGKVIEIPHEVTPRSRRIAVLLNEDTPRIRASGLPRIALAPR